MFPAPDLLKVFFSNRTECLFQAFKKELFATSHPFAKRMTIVPSAAMKDWLLMQMARDEDLAIAAGIEITFLEPAIGCLSTLLNQSTSAREAINNNLHDGTSAKAPAVKRSEATQYCEYGVASDRFNPGALAPSDRANYCLAPPEQKKEPGRLALALALEATIIDTIQNFHQYSSSLQGQWKPLLDYLGVEVHPYLLSGRILKRITALSDSLAPLFIDYGSYGGQMISQWGLVPVSPNIHWQQLLWMALETRYSIWNYPYRKLESFEVDSDWTANEMQVHLFGLSYLSPLQHRFFQKVAFHIPVNYYLFSPCKQFWSDLLSDKEGARLKKYWMGQKISDSQQATLEDLLSEHHPLLANFGRLGREMATQIEASDPLLYEHYLISSAYSNHVDSSETPDVEKEENSHPLTILEVIQGDMVLMRDPNTTDKIPFDCYDRTVQFHGAPKPMREAQVVHDTILSILDAHRHDADPITPTDILIMAPDPSIYAPSLRAVFGSSNSNLHLKMMDAHSVTHHSLIQGFLHLLELSFGRWDINALLRLMEYPEFQMKHQFSPEDIRTIGIWVKESGICWGHDELHRNELLKRDHCHSEMVGGSRHGTWEHGLGSLLEGMAMSSATAHEGDFNPLQGVESIQGELLGKFLAITRSLLADLKPLANGSFLSLTDWSAYLKCLAESYFAPCDEKESWKILDIHLGSFENVIDGLEGAAYAFHSIYYHLKKGLQTEKITHRDSNLQAVRFSSLLAMRAVPAKVIILMGMNDQTFPRTDKIQSMNLLSTSPEKDYCPSSVDLDRYIFIEALFSASRYFIATYSSQLPGESGEQSPSLLIKELLNYVDSACLLPEKPPSQHCLHLHPLHSFHKSYFSSSSGLKSHSERGYSAAVVHYGANKKQPKNFLSLLIAPVKITEAGPHHISLNDLSSFVRHPLKNYCNKGLNLYINDRTKNVYEEHEDLLLSSLDKYSLVKEGISNKETLSTAEKNGKLPAGPFKGIEIERVTNEIKQIKSNLHRYGIDADALFSIEFNERHQTAELVSSSKPFSKPSWKTPSLTLKGTCFGDIHLTGHLDDVSSSGLVLFAEDSLKEVIKAWPKILMFGYLVDAYELPIARQIIFAKGEKGSCKALDFCSSEQLLIHLAEYYLRHQGSLSPLMPVENIKLCRRCHKSLFGTNKKLNTKTRTSSKATRMH